MLDAHYAGARMSQAFSLAQVAPISDHAPRTYAERGASVPFTTPVLGGAYVRIGPAGAAELLVCNPSGSRGVYILPLRNLQAICQPTLHDTLVHAEIGPLTAFTPGAIRKAVRKVVATGITGRVAMRSAALAEPALMTAQFNARTALRQALAVQAGSETAIDALAERLGCPGKILMASLLACADMLAEIGIMPGTRDHSMARRVARLGGMARALPDVQSAAAAGVTRDMATLAALSQSTHALAAALLADMERQLGDISTLMLAFQREPLVVSQALSRIDWVMDGWDRICALWHEATSQQPMPNRLALLEMASQAPKLPTEAFGWGMPGVPPPPDIRGTDAAATTDTAGGFIDWTSQVTLADLVARNERVVAALVRAA